jgi:branched-subunit amino acid transport protein
MARSPYSTLPDALKRSIHFVALAVLLTGIVWLALRFAPGNWIDDASSRHLQAQLLKFHGAAAMLALIALGTLLIAHIVPGLKNPQNRVAGITLLACAGTLVLTGWGLYYVGDDELRRWASNIHIAIGAAVTFSFIWHVRFRKRCTG